MPSPSPSSMTIVSLSAFLLLLLLPTSTYATITTIDFTTPIISGDWTDYSVPPVIFTAGASYLGTTCLQIGINTSYVYTKLECTPDPTYTTSFPEETVPSTCVEVPDPSKECNVMLPHNCLHGKGHSVANTFASVDMIIPAAWQNKNRNALIYVDLLSVDDVDYAEMVGMHFLTRDDATMEVAYYDYTTSTWVPVAIGVTVDTWYRVRFLLEASILSIEVAKINADATNTSCVSTSVIDTTYVFNETHNFSATTFDVVSLLAENLGEEYYDIHFANFMYGDIAEAPDCDWVAPASTLLQDWEYVMIGVGSFIVLVVAIISICCKRDCMTQAKKLRAFFESHARKPPQAVVEMATV